MLDQVRNTCAAMRDVLTGGRSRSEAPPTVAGFRVQDTVAIACRRVTFTSRRYRSTGATEVARGTVKWFNSTKGYGFIQPSGGGKDVFVHISAVERAGASTLNEGQEVEYEMTSNRGKESAENLRLR